MTKNSKDQEIGLICGECSNGIFTIQAVGSKVTVTCTKCYTKYKVLTPVKFKRIFKTIKKEVEVLVQ